MERTPFERDTLKIPGRCVAAYRAINGEYGMCPRPDGWWSHDAVTAKLVLSELPGSGDVRRKLQLLHESCPHIVEREYLDRKTGKIHRRIEDCGAPVALFRLTAEYDPRRRVNLIAQPTTLFPEV